MERRVNIQLKAAKAAKRKQSLVRPTREQAEEAVRTLLLWAGDDPTREGLLDTPKRVAKSYAEFFKGYEEDPVEILSRTFEETEGYDEMILLRDIRLESHCEHHMVPITGKAHVAYLPGQARGGDFQARPRRGRLCQASANPGKTHRADRQHHPGGAAAARRGGGD